MDLTIRQAEQEDQGEEGRHVHNGYRRVFLRKRLR